MFVLYQAFLLAHNMLIIAEDGIVNGVTSDGFHHIECRCTVKEREFERLRDLYCEILSAPKSQPFYTKLFSIGGNTHSIRAAEETSNQNIHSSFSYDLYIKCSFQRCRKVYHMKCYRTHFVRSGENYIFNKSCPCTGKTTIDFYRFLKLHTDEYVVCNTKKKILFERIFVISLITDSYFCDLLDKMEYTFQDTQFLIKRLEKEQNPNKTHILVSARLYSAIIDKNSTFREVFEALAAQWQMMDPEKSSRYLDGYNFLSEKVINERLSPEEVSKMIFELIRDSPNYFNLDSTKLYDLLLGAYMATEPSSAQILDFFDTFLFTDCAEILVDFYGSKEEWDRKMPSFIALYQRIEKKLFLRNTYTTLQYEYFFNESVSIMKKYAKFKEFDLAILFNYLIRRLHSINVSNSNTKSVYEQHMDQKYGTLSKRVKSASVSSFVCLNTFENIQFYSSFIDDSNIGTDKVIDLVKYFVYDGILHELLPKDALTKDSAYALFRITAIYEKRIKQPIMRYAYLAKNARYVSNTLFAERDVRELHLRYSRSKEDLNAYRLEYPQDFASLCIETQKLPGKLLLERSVIMLLRECTKLNSLIIDNIEYLNSSIIYRSCIPECLLEDYMRHSYASLDTAGFFVLYIKENHKIFENLTNDDIFRWCTKHRILQHLNGIEDSLIENKQYFSKFIQLYFPFILEWLDSLHYETSIVYLSDNMLGLCDLACLYGKYDHIEIIDYLARTKHAFYFIHKFLLRITATSRREVLESIFMRLAAGTSSNTNDLLTAMAKYLEISYAMDPHYIREFDNPQYDFRKDGIVLCGFEELDRVNLYGALAKCRKGAVLELFIKHKEFSEKFLEHVYYIPRNVIEELRRIQIVKRG
ncbi:hypothetical protein ENBRE01_2788 [Enteropsectra breve]|nr:hypothetical protein ENBRE01_2788 [Enteropsectra breve]